MAKHLSKKKIFFFYKNTLCTENGRSISLLSVYWQLRHRQMDNFPAFIAQNLLINENIMSFFQFCIIVIPSVLLSFLPDYCHFFGIIVISELVLFLPNYFHFKYLSSWISSCTLPHPNGQKIGQPYLRVMLNSIFCV